MTVQFDLETPEADGAKVAVTLAALPIAYLHCISTPSGLKWYAAMINGPTGNAKVGREAAAADVLAWATGGAPAYLMQGLPASEKASLYAWQPTPAPKPTFWQRVKAVFA